MSVGIPRRLKRGETDGLSSTLILYTLALPASFSAAASTAGDIARQGPHQGAQKSTRIGSLDCNNSSSSPASFISCTYRFIILLLNGRFMNSKIDCGSWRPPWRPSQKRSFSFSESLLCCQPQVQQAYQSSNH